MQYRVMYRISKAVADFKDMEPIQVYATASTIGEAVSKADPLFAKQRQQPSYIRDIWIEIEIPKVAG